MGHLLCRSERNLAIAVIDHDKVVAGAMILVKSKLKFGIQGGVMIKLFDGLFVWIRNVLPFGKDKVYLLKDE